MVRTEDGQRYLKRNGLAWHWLMMLGIGTLPFPYFVIISLTSFLGLCIFQTYRQPGRLFHLLNQHGLLGISLLIVGSAQFAFDSEEAYLQAAHFVPFFWIWGSLVLYLKRASHPWQQISQWVVVLVLTALPLNLVGVVEYGWKRGYFMDLASRLTPISWLYIGDPTHPRTFSLFDYPNTLASYLVMILGLNIGLLLVPYGSSFLRGWPRWLRGLFVLNLVLTLLCLYCSGSRNGYLVAAVLLTISIFGMRSHRWLKLLGIAGLTLIAITTARFGLAGRHFSWSWFTDDPRVHVWRLALQLTQERPWLGHGLGNYKLLYDGEAPGYAFIAHAHNLWLMLAAETGILVAVALTVSVGVMCFRGARSLFRLQKHPERYAILLSYSLCVLGTVLFSMLDVTLFEVRVNLLGWLSLAVLYSSPELSLNPADPLDQLHGPQPKIQNHRRTETCSQ